MCLYPRMHKNPKYRKSKKNGGVIPPVSDDRVLYVPIGCKKCIECRKQKANEWKLRLFEDIKHNKNGRFITLTLSNESYKELNTEIPDVEIKGKYVDGEYKEKEVNICGYQRDNAIITLATRYFLERWRKKYKKSLRHWFITELGHNGTENIHIHGIVWQPDYWEGTWLEFMTEVGKVWQYGFIWKYKNERHRLTGKLTPTNYVSERTINYITKYVTKVDIDHKLYEGKILTSAGIGRGYTTGERDWKRNKYNGLNTEETYRTREGYKMSLPIYWRNKIYSEAEREELWKQKLDKQERWICGEKVDISQSERAYYALLEHYRLKNDELGYSNDRIDWRRSKYEQERRIIMQRHRLGIEYPIEWDA